MGFQVMMKLLKKKKAQYFHNLLLAMWIMFLDFDKLKEVKNRSYGLLCIIIHAIFFYGRSQKMLKTMTKM